MDSDISSDEESVDLFELKSNLSQLSDLATGRVVDIIRKCEPTLISDLSEFSINLSELERNTVGAIYSFIQSCLAKKKRKLKLPFKTTQKVILSMQKSGEIIQNTPNSTEADVVDLDSSDDIIDLDSTDSDNKDASSDVICLN